MLYLHQGQVWARVKQTRLSRSGNGSQFMGVMRDGKRVRTWRESSRSASTRWYRWVPRVGDVCLWKRINGSETTQTRVLVTSIYAARHPETGEWDVCVETDSTQRAWDGASIPTGEVSARALRPEEVAREWATEPIQYAGVPIGTRYTCGRLEVVLDLDGSEAPNLKATRQGAYTAASSLAEKAYVVLFERTNGDIQPPKCEEGELVRELIHDSYGPDPWDWGPELVVNARFIFPGMVGFAYNPWKKAGEALGLLD